MRHPPGSAQAHGPVKHPDGDFAYAGQLAGAARQNETCASFNARAGRPQAVTQKLKGFLNAGRDDALEQGSGRNDRSRAGIIASGRRFDHFAVFIGRGDGRSVQGLDPLCARKRGRKAAGDVGRNMLPADREGLHVDQAAIGEHRRGG